MISFKQFLFELEHLHDTRSKKGDEFLDHLLNDEIDVNIKIDQAAFVVKKQDGNVKFYGREGREEITKIKRSIMDIYEDAIKHIEQKAKKLPDNTEVYLELFHDKLKTIVQYKTKPKNNLIISYIKKDGKILNPNDPFNYKVAELLDVAPPPVIFSGKLNEKQKTLIKQFINSSEEERKQKYGKTKFLDFIMSLFVTPSELKWLQEGGYEGVVFYFKNNAYSAKIVDPMFTATKQQEEDFNLFKQQLNEFVHDYLNKHLDEVAEKFVKSSAIQTTEDVFIEFISLLTQDAIKQYGEQLHKQLDKFQQEQISRRFSNITYSLLPSYIKQLSKKYWWTEELFTMFTLLLQKEKTKINIKQGLTKERKEAINNMVAKLRSRGLVK